MSHKVSWDDGASYEDVIEAVRRVFVRDGVPRHVDADGNIRKYDWELLDLDYVADAYDDHVKRLLDGQQG